MRPHPNASMRLTDHITTTSRDKVDNCRSHTLGSLTANSSTKFYNYEASINWLANIRIGSASGAIESTFSHDFEGRFTNQTGVVAKTLN
jgi:hypothetical protein